MVVPVERVRVRFEAEVTVDGDQAKERWRSDDEGAILEGKTAVWSSSSCLGIGTSSDVPLVVPLGTVAAVDEGSIELAVMLAVRCPVSAFSRS